MILFFDILALQGAQERFRGVSTWKKLQGEGEEEDEADEKEAPLPGGKPPVIGIQIVQDSTSHFRKQKNPKNRNSLLHEP